MATLKESFNFQHYYKVRQQREKQHLPVAPLSVDLPNHPLLGHHITDTETGKLYTIDKVCKQWYCGWYIVIFPVDSDRSHAMVYWTNINCIDSNVILPAIKEAHQDWQLI